MAQTRTYPDAEAVARAAADYLYELISGCVAEHGVCHVALPGGGTPARCLELLAGSDLPGRDIHWYLGDERCYPPMHPERNDSMIEQCLWSRIDAPPANRHRIPAELGPERAAEEYSALINGIGRLDVIVLGMGEDGPTASLFPGNAALDDERAVVPVFNAPKAPPERVSLGLATLQAGVQRVVLVTGNNKHEALMRIQKGEPLPAGLIGRSCWFVDQAAAKQAREPV